MLVDVPNTLILVRFTDGEEIERYADSEWTPEEIAAMFLFELGDEIADMMIVRIG